MTNLPPAAQQSIILFLLISVGYVAGKLGVLKGESVRSLSRFLLDFTLPALIVMSMQRPFEAALRDRAFTILGLSFAIYALAFPLAFLVTKAYRGAGRPELGVHRFAMCFSNVSFMGFPVANSILGAESVFMVSVYNIPFQLLAFSVGVALIRSGQAANGPKPTGKDTWKVALAEVKKAILNPAISSAFIGFIFFLLEIRIPEPLAGAMHLLGETTTPLAMAVIGATLAASSLGGILKNWRLWFTITYRLAIFPLVVYMVASLVGLQGMDLAVPVIIAAMPVAANTTILAGVYGGDAATGSALVFVSTLISLVSIPVLGSFLS